MNFGKDPTTEEFLAEVRRTQAELLELQEETWKGDEKEIQKILSEEPPNLPGTIRDFYVRLLQVIWKRGYNSGSGDMFDYMSRKLGAGAVIDYVEMFEKMSKTKLENN